MIDLLVLVLLVVGIVLATAKLKISPFLALIAAALIGAFAFRLPLADIVPTISTAFGSSLGNIGLVILFGTMIGVILERSGGAISMADALIRWLGTRFPTLTMSIIGYVVSIPVFCDSGYVILNSLRKAIAVRTGVSALAMSIALMTGLYATHTLVPPTPGPLAAAENIGAGDYLGLIIAIGLPVAAVAAFAGLLFAQTFAKKPFAPAPDPEGAQEVTQSWDELRASYGKLPSAWLAFLPILLPLVLICAASIAKLPNRPLGESTLYDIVTFIGTPTIALLIGLVAATLLLSGHGKLATFNANIAEAIRVAAPILFITAAGAAFGAVLAKSTITTFLSENLAGLGIGLAVPFSSPPR